MFRNGARTGFLLRFITSVAGRFIALGVDFPFIERALTPIWWLFLTHEI